MALSLTSPRTSPWTKRLNQGLEHRRKPFRNMIEIIACISWRALLFRIWVNGGSARLLWILCHCRLYGREGKPRGRLQLGTLGVASTACCLGFYHFFETCFAPWTPWATWTCRTYGVPAYVPAHVPAHVHSLSSRITSLVFVRVMHQKLWPHQLCVSADDNLIICHTLANAFWCTET